MRIVVNDLKVLELIIQDRDRLTLYDQFWKGTRFARQLLPEGRPAETARVTENMATALLKVFEDKTLTFEVALDREAMEDLRKPERITTPGGRTSIAAIRDGAGHADLFWALALAVRAAESSHVPVAYSRVTGLITQDNIGNLGLGPLTKKFIL